MDKFSKGPWKADQFQGLTAGWWRVISETDNICIVSDSDKQPAEANAQLMAAAPDLFEAAVELIEELTNAMPQVHRYSEVLKLKRAIKKALGEA